MEKLKNIFKDYKLYIFFLITIVFFGTYAKMQFATDTYSVFAMPTRDIVNHFLSSGRILSAMWFALVGVLRLGITSKNILTYSIAILSTTIALYKLNLIVKKFIQNNFLSIIVTTLIIINPFSVEYFMYLEKGVLLLSILMAVCAVEQFVKYLEDKGKGKKHLVFSFIFMLISTFSYQGTVAIYIAIASIFIVKYSKNIKDFIVNNIWMFLCYGLPAIINLLIIRIFFSNARVNGAVNFADTLEKIVDGCKKMLATYNILPKYFFLIMTTIAILISLIIMIKSKKISKIFGLIYVAVLDVLITLAPFAMQNTDSIWFVARSSYAFASLFGLIILYTCVNIEKEEGLKNTLFNTICVIFAIVQFICFNNIEIAHYNLNYTDKMNSIEIGKMINEYQEETGIEVTNICIYLDASHAFSYQNIFTSGDMNVSGFGPDWSDVEMINYYNGLKLVRAEKDEELQNQFAEKDWDSFNKEQVIFVGNTIHLCKF